MGLWREAEREMVGLVSRGIVGCFTGAHGRKKDDVQISGSDNVDEGKCLRAA